VSVIRFTILGEPASKANQRQIVSMPIAGDACPRCTKPKPRGARACVCGASFTRPQVIKSKKALGYEADALRQIPPVHRVRLDGPVKVSLRIFYSTERPDLDESVVLDVLQDRWKGRGEERVLVQKGVIRNDRQVREKHVYHGIDRKNPRAEIEIEPMQPQTVELLPLDLDVPKERPIKIVPTRADGKPF
jgi:Holliday junction resolvase RusA-like endonuclease